MSSDSSATGLLILAAAVLGFLFYAYFAICLVVIARKTDTPNGWMAWVPVLNLVLMCSVARKPGWWVVLCLVPVVNLLVFVALWMGIAEQRGRPAWVGLLMLLPPISLIVPLWLASGDGAPPASSAAPAVRRCSGCARVMEPDEAFCGSCGQPTRPPAPVAASGGGGGMACCAGVALVGLAVPLGVLGWFLWGGGGGYQAPDRQPPAVSKVAAGTLRELPVDPSTDSPARPGALLTQTLEPGRTPEVPPERLPPGIAASSLPYLGGAVTSAEYTRAGRPGSVGVTVLDSTGNPGAPAKVVQKVRDAAPAGAVTKKAEVETPDGRVYDGITVAGEGATTIVLVNPEGTSILILYSPKPEGEDLARTLATTAGNGQGAAAYPEETTALGLLPAALPPDFRLISMAVYPEAMIQRALAEAATDGKGGAVPPEVEQLLETLRMFVPRQLVLAQYEGPGGKEWHSLVAEYAAPAQAWQNWQLLSWSLGFGGKGTSVPAKSGATPGLLFAEDDGRLLLYRAGPYLVLLGGPSDATPALLGALAASLQL